MGSIWSIRRSATDRKLTGLSAGIAAYLGIDPVLVRVLFVVLALSGGVGVVVYGAGWLLFPVEGEDTARIDRLLGSRAREWSPAARVVVLVVCGMALLNVLHQVTPFSVVPAGIVAAIWYFGYYRNRPTNRPTHRSARAPWPPQPSQAPSTPSTPADATQRMHAPDAAEPAGQAADWPQAQDPRDAFLSYPDPVGLYGDPEPAKPAAPSLRSSRSARRLRLVSLLALGLTVAALSIADALGATVSATAFVGAALLVVGLTLIAATWLGRARGILALGILLLVALLISAVPHRSVSAEDWSAPAQRFTTLADLPAGTITQDVGQLNLDLSDLTMEHSATIPVHLGTGMMTVRAPDGVNVVVRYHIGAGAFMAPDDIFDAGPELDKEVTVQSVPGADTLTLDLSVNRGAVVVER
ncbi:MAG TPA: PspC domain-containing protein [Propionibacteriaceae bacterium]|nr:PspC domain-containing protein [Propionibacteriaceae bacterium]